MSWSVFYKTFGQTGRDEVFNNEGIGRKLWDFLRENSLSKIITVNFSPYAVPVYHKLGFVDTDTEQLSDGMRYTPMQFIK